jgi:hypothetical protein
MRENVIAGLKQKRPHLHQTDTLPEPSSRNLEKELIKDVKLRWEL